MVSASRTVVGQWATTVRVHASSIALLCESKNRSPSPSMPSSHEPSGGNSNSAARRNAISTTPARDSAKDTVLLMLLIRLSDAVENFSDKARTYNMAWASDRHPDSQR